MNLVVFLSCLVNVSGLQSIICLHLPVGHQVKRRHSVLIPSLERLDVLCNHIVKKLVHISVSASAISQNELESICKLDILHPT